MILVLLLMQPAVYTGCILLLLNAVASHDAKGIGLYFQKCSQTVQKYTQPMTSPCLTCSSVSHYSKGNGWKYPGLTFLGIYFFFFNHSYLLLDFNTIPTSIDGQFTERTSLEVISVMSLRTTPVLGSHL